MKNFKILLLVLMAFAIRTVSAQKKISQLPELTTPAPTDVLPIVNGNETKKITVANLVAASPAFTDAEIIGNYLYLISEDTTIIDLSSILAWNSNGSQLTPVDSNLSLNFNETLIIDDSLDLGFGKFPFSGISKKIGTYNYAVGYLDLTPFQTKKMVITSFNSSSNVTMGIDSTGVNIFSKLANTDRARININNSALDLKYDTVSAHVNYNGFVVPSLPSEPSGEPGAIYYNTSTEIFRKYGALGWENL